MKNIRADILKSVNIVDVVSRYLSLERQGQNYKAVCPFHDDTDPSLIVSEEKQIFKCFVCGVGGTAIEFVKNYENISLDKTYSKFAEDLDLNYKVKKKSPQEVLLEDVATFYSSILKNSQLGKDAYNYLRGERNINEDVINFFELGFSPGGDALKLYLTEKMSEKHEYSQMEIDSIGIFNKIGKDFFNNRLIIPIKNATGTIVGFSGRTLKKDDKIKYLNSKDSKFFRKNELIYNLDSYVSQNDHSLILVEGYFDVISAHQFGIENTGATMGVALTEKHIKQLKYHKIKKVYLGFDGDMPGKEATMKSAPILLSAGFDVEILDYGKFKDIDEYLQGGGDAHALKGKGISYFEFFIKNKSLETYGEKIENVKELTKILRQMPDNEAKLFAVELISKEVEVDKHQLMASVSKKTREVPVVENKNIGVSRKRENTNVRDFNKQIELISDTEQILFYLAARDKDKFIELQSAIAENRFTFKQLDEIFDKLKEYYASHDSYNILEIIDIVPEYNVIEEEIKKTIYYRHDNDVKINDILKDEKVKKQTKLFSKNR